MAIPVADPVQTPTITAGTYSTGEAVGGLLTFASVGEDGSNSESGSVIIRVTITDKGKQDALLELHLFDQSFTAMADQATWAPSDADLVNEIGVISVSTYYDGNANSVGQANVTFPVKCNNSNGALYGQLVVREGPTYTSTSDLQVRLTVIKG